MTVDTSSPGRLRIVVLTRNLPPLVGGMETLTWHMLDQLSNQFDVIVVGPKGSKARLPPGVHGREVTAKPLALFLVHMMLISFWICLIKRPDRVLAANGLTAPFAWVGAKLSGARSSVYLHGLDIKTRNPVYRAIWLPFIRRCSLVFVNSRYTREVAEKSGVPDEQIFVLKPAVSIPDWDAAEDARLRFRFRYGINNSPVVLYVGRLTPGKGLLPFIEHCLPGLVANMPFLRLVVIGGDATEGLGANGNYSERLRRAVARRRLGDNVIFLGPRAFGDAEISEAYFASDVFIFPAQNQDEEKVEGFGMVALEAASHGLPTVGFRVGGLIDSVGDGACGRLVPPSDYISFSKSVVEFIERGEKQIKLPCRQFAEIHSWKAFGIEMRAAFAE